MACKLCLFLSVTGVPVYAMHAELKSWVKKASTIKIVSLDATKKVPIVNVTTVLNIKNILQESEGVPADQQVLYAVWTKPWTLWLEQERSEALDNMRPIKSAMAHYNTDRFTMRLDLR